MSFYSATRLDLMQSLKSPLNPKTWLVAKFLNLIQFDSRLKGYCFHSCKYFGNSATTGIVPVWWFALLNI